MSSQSHNPQLAKSHRSYTVEEIADLYSIHKNTVREWIKNGLEVCDSKRPTLVKGSVLKEFLSRRRLSKKRPCLPDEMYCLKCRSPKKPAGEMADYYPKTPELGNLVGICPDCETLMNRRTSLAKLPLIQAHLQVTFSQATPHIDQRQLPTLNSDLDKGA